MRWRAPGLGWLLMAACLAGAWVQALAQTTQVEHSQTESTTPAEDGAGVSMEFLEFLGEWEAGNGEWVDPAELQSAGWPVTSDDAADTTNKGIGNGQ